MPRGLSITVAVVAIAAAFGAARLLDNAWRRAAVTPATTATAEDGPSKTVLPEGTVETAPSPVGPPDAADLLSQRLNEKLDAATAAAVRGRAENLRKQLLDAAAVADATAAGQMAKEIGDERAQRADRMRGGTMAFLRNLERNSSPQWELLRSAEKFGALFARKTDAGAIDGTTLRYGSPPPDGTTIRFPAGTFVLDVQAMSRWKPFPKDLVIDGAGMDATLLLPNGEFRQDGDVPGLTISNATWFGRDAIADFGSGAAWTVTLDRCRILAFDCGAGGSVMLYGDAGALSAKDCRIEGGFGRSPGYANLLRGDGVLARFERCTFVGPFRDLSSGHDECVLFTGCQFLSLPGPAAPGSTRQREFAGCTFDIVDEQAWRSKRQRPLSDINPAWRDPKR